MNEAREASARTHFLVRASCVSVIVALRLGTTGILCRAVRSADPIAAPLSPRRIEKAKGFSGGEAFCRRSVDDHDRLRDLDARLSQPAAVDEGLDAGRPRAVELGPVGRIDVAGERKTLSRGDLHQE